MFTRITFTMSKDHPTDKTWRLYERIVAALEAENVGIEMSITPNAKIVGGISLQERQIDVLIDARWGDDISKRIIVDAKLYRTKLDIKDVESFEGMMKDCGAERGVLVCPNGWTEAAQRRARDAITVKLLALEEIEESTVWAHFDDCLGECSQQPNKRKLTGLVLWDAEHFLSIDEMYAIIFTGKCDVCHNFQIWCWDCGEKFAIGEEDEYTCSCERQWISVIEEETDDTTGNTLNAVHLLLIVNDSLWPLDRRRLR
jgi:hypothetical protein